MSRGFIFGTWNRDAVGASLVRGPWLPPRDCYVMCDVGVCSWFEQHDSREYLSGASNRPPGRHRIQNVEGPVLDPCAKQMYCKRGPKVDHLRIESGPSWRACFWPLYFIRCAEALQAAMCAKSQAWSYFNTNSIRGGNLELGRPVFASLVFLVLLGPKGAPSLWQVEVKAVQTPPWTPELAQVHVTDPASPHCPRNKDQSCKSHKPKVWSQEPTPATLHASSPFCTRQQAQKALSVHVAVLDLSLVWLTLLESEIGRGNSISGLNNSGGKSKPTWHQMFLGQKSQNKWRPNCLVSGSQIPRSTNPTN